MDVLIVYGSTYGDTADAAERIATELQRFEGVRLEIADVAYRSLANLSDYDAILAGCSTWDQGEVQGDWEGRLHELRAVDLTRVPVALFGVGDQFGYPDTFQDAMGRLAAAFEARGATLIGSWPASDYTFTTSRARRGNHFVGLALDATSQDHLTASRVRRWVAGLAEELRLAPPAAIADALA